jgi:hypothetical protein
MSLQKQRGQGKPVLRSHPRPRVQMKKAHELVTTGTPKQSGLPCAMVYGLFCALPGVRDLLVTVIGAMREALLPTWHQPRGARTTQLRRPRQAPLVSQRRRVHRIPPRVRDDRDTPLVPERDGDRICMTSDYRKDKYFSFSIWTCQIRLKRLDKFEFWRNAFFKAFGRRDEPKTRLVGLSGDSISERIAKRRRV